VTALTANPQTDASPSQLSITEHDLIADLQQTVARLQARLAELERPPGQWLPLKTAAHACGIEYERCRTWAAASLIEARREGRRWLVNVVSLRARLTALGIAHRERE
jgi:hypothetical protein